MKKVYFKPSGCDHIDKMRNESIYDFIYNYGSEILVKGYRNDFNIYNQYINERIKFEFGDAFKIFNKEEINVIKDFTVNSKEDYNEKIIWYFDRYIKRNPFKETDLFSLVHLKTKFIKYVPAIFVEQSSLNIDLSDEQLIFCSSFS